MLLTVTIQHIIIMLKYKQPYLQPYKGISTRHTCPACEAKNSFTLYLNGDTHEPINSKVGKCNREIKCGYHYTPKQFFLDNPMPIDSYVYPINNRKPSEPHGTIPFSMVEKSASYQSNFVRFLCEIMTEEQIRQIGENYALGATKNKEVIFWQIDTKGKVRTGKIMQYNPETGKRIKHQTGTINWVHNELKKTKELPEDFNLKQSFFGEHLLKIYPEKTVAVVESEKTACIASVVHPELIWLGAGNLNGISVEKCQILKGRNVILFPDLKAHNIWSAKAEEIKKLLGINVKVSNLLENIATNQEKEKGLDIADFLIESLKNKRWNYNTPPPQQPPINQYSQTLNKFIIFNPAVQYMIDMLSLEEVC